MHQEIELKLQLASASDYHRLRARLIELGLPHRDQLQENSYFDDARGRLAASRIAVRVRRLAEGGVLTLKSAGSSVAGVARRPEAEVDLSAAEVEEVLADPGRILSRLPTLFDDLGLDPALLADLRELNLVGHMQTRRRRVAVPLRGRTLQFEIDRSEYPDGSVVYELEVEFDEGSDPRPLRRAVEDFLTSHAIAFERSDLSKRERLARSLEDPQPGAS